jgi:hypothetical protein
MLMSAANEEGEAERTWVFTFRLPKGIPNYPRFVARLLKHLKRVWGVRCVALQESSEMLRLRKIIEDLAERCARQAELLSRRAERKVVNR